MTDVISFPGHQPGTFNHTDDLHSQIEPLMRFDTRGVNAVPPAKHHFAEQNADHRPSPPPSHQSSPLASNIESVDPIPGNQLQPQPSPTHQHAVANNDHTVQPPALTDNQSSADPIINTNGVPKDPNLLDSSDLHKLSDQDLYNKGGKQLEAAKEAYTKYGRHKLAHDAKEAIRPFIDCAELSKSKQTVGMDHFKTSSELVEALKKIKLLSGTPKGLAVTIQFPGEEVISMIPPGEALKKKNPKQVWEYYRLAFQALHLQEQEYNSGNDNALTQAEAALNNVVAALKATRKAIDERGLMDKLGENSPKGSQLEVDYHEFTEKGVSFRRVAKGDLLSHSFEAKGKVPDPTKNPAESSLPTPIDELATITDDSVAPIGGSNAPAPTPVASQSNNGTSVVTPRTPSSNTQTPVQPA